MSFHPLPPRAVPLSEVAGDHPRLILCADGGGSKVMVVVRAADGTEVRGTSGPCNVQSVGRGPAAERILEATYRALAQLPASYLPAGFQLPQLQPQLPPAVQHLRNASPAPSGANTPRIKLPPMTKSLFAYCWIALAGIQSEDDSERFKPYVSNALHVPTERIFMGNDVNLLAAPALLMSGIDHVVALVCGTGTGARTIKVETKAELPPSPPVEARDAGSGESESDGSRPTTPKVRSLPIEDAGQTRGWGYMIDDEGSAYWIGRLAMRYLLTQRDRENSPLIHSSELPVRGPLYRDLMAYFDIKDPADLIRIVALMEPDFVEGLGIGEASAKRNAYLAGAARVVFKWAFPDEGGVTVSTPEEEEAHRAATSIARNAIRPVAELVTLALGDQTVVRPESTALDLGGGLMNSKGYVQLLLDALRSDGIVFRNVLVVDDAAGEGAKALAAVIFGSS